MALLSLVPRLTDAACFASGHAAFDLEFCLGSTRASCVESH